MTAESLPADLLERVVAAQNVAWYEWTDGDKTIRMSRALTDLFGHDPGTWSVQRHLAGMHPDDVPDYRSAQAAFLKGAATQAEFTYRTRVASGAYRWIHDRRIAERNAAGRVVRMTGTITDVTEAREQEAQNRAYAARQEASIEVLRAIAASPDDPQPVFELIARHARALCGASTTSLTEFDGTLMYARVQEGFDPESSRAWFATYPRPPGRDTGHGRAILARKIQHLRDIGADRDIYQAGRDLGVKSQLSVPLMRDGNPIGAIALGRFEPGGFDEAQTALVESFAEQAALAIASASTLRELRERTAQLAERNTAFAERIDHQAATIDVLKAMSASPGDPQPVFELIVKRARDICGAYGSTVFETDGALIHWRAATGVSDDPKAREALVAMYPIPTSSDMPSAHAIRDRTVVRIDNLGSQQELPSELRNITAKSLVIVPMMRAGTAIGAISMGSRETGGFSDTQVALLETFAEQAVIAITSAETYRALQVRTADLQESLEQQTVTADVLNVISRSTFDLDPVLNAVAETAARLCDADQAIIARYEDGIGWLAANFGFPAGYEDRYRSIGRMQITPDSPAVSWRSIREGRVVHIEDVAGVPNYPRASIEFGKQRTSLGVPLLRDGQAIGCIVLARQRVKPFTDRQIELVSTFADQAVIAIENTRLLTEQREALERQTATAEVLRVINANPGELTPVFDIIADKAMVLCEADMGAFSPYDGERFHLVQSRNYTTEYVEHLRDGWKSTPGSVSERLLQEDGYVHIPDIASHPAYAISSNLRPMHELGGISTLLLVAVRNESRLLGLFTLCRREARGFTDREISLVLDFAAQAAIAMENARLLTEQREALERQTAMAEVLQVINANPGNIAPVFEAILEKAHTLCGATMGSLQIYDGDRVRAVAVRGVPEDPDSTRMQRMLMDGFRDKGAASRINRISHVRDMADVLARNPDDPLIRAVVESSGVRTQLLVPLAKDGVVLGRISAGRPEVKPFSDTEIALLENFAAQAVIAMDNARLLNEIRQRQSELDITFENMGDGVAMFDADQKLAAWNRNFQDILDLPDDAVRVGLPFVDYIRDLAAKGEYGPDADADGQIARMTALLGHASRFERERPNGHVIDIRQNPIPGGGFVIIYADITERKRAEEAVRAARDAAEAALRDLRIAQASLIQAEKMASLGQLTAGIAHEIKNPLNFVNNFAALSVELLAELKDAVAARDDEEIEDLTAMLTSNLEKIEQHGKRADGIVKSMLEHSRESSGERIDTDLNALAGEALNLAYHGARAQDQTFNITLDRDFAEGIAPVTLAPQEITRVLLNLCSNGFYAARKRELAEPGHKPVLRLTTRDRGDAVEIRVRDNGVGVPPDIVDKLFQPFFTTKPTGEGTGLGLSITYDIVTKQHGGTISVASAINDFTEFTVTLPRNAVAEGARA